jgi:ankyrin repeat protein
LAKRVLAWIAYAFRPLLVKELQHTMAVELNTAKMDAEAKDILILYVLAWLSLTKSAVNSVEADSNDNNGRIPLSWMAEYGEEDVVRLLIAQNDVEADSKNNYGRIPLLWAALHGHSAVVKLLVERNDVEADSIDVHGQTPSFAARNGHEAVETDSKDNNCWIPAPWAAENGHDEW